MQLLPTSDFSRWEALLEGVLCYLDLIISLGFDLLNEHIMLRFSKDLPRSY